MPIRVVCFDLGGVVVRICHSFVEAVQAAELPLVDAQRLLEPDSVARRRDAIWAHQVGEFDFDEYCRRMSLAVDGLYLPDQVRALHAAWLIGEYPGVLDLVTELSSNAGVRLACLSNTNDGHWEQMMSAPELFPTLHRLHLQLASHLLRLAKPERPSMTLRPRPLAPVLARSSSSTTCRRTSRQRARLAGMPNASTQRETRRSRCVSTCARTASSRITGAAEGGGPRGRFGTTRPALAAPGDCLPALSPARALALPRRGALHACAGRPKIGGVT